MQKKKKTIKNLNFGCAECSIPFTNTKDAIQ